MFYGFCRQLQDAHAVDEDRLPMSFFWQTNDGTRTLRRACCHKWLVAAHRLGAGTPIANSQRAINDRGYRDVMSHDENSYCQFFVELTHERDDLLRSSRVEFAGWLVGEE